MVKIQMQNKINDTRMPIFLLKNTYKNIKKETGKANKKEHTNKSGKGQTITRPFPHMFLGPDTP